MSRPLPEEKAFPCCYLVTAFWNEESCRVCVKAVQGKLLTLGKSFLLKVGLKTDEMGRVLKAFTIYSCLGPLIFSYQSPNMTACIADVI